MKKQLLPAKLIFIDGTTFAGWSFGFPKGRSGEVVFATGMTGYPESLTDPSYSGQIIVMTFPMIGNYGVPDHPFESDRIQAQGLIVQEYTNEYSHPHAKKSLAQWLQEEEVPAIFGIDTRAVTKLLREKGNMLGQIVIDREKPLKKIEDPNAQNLIAEVSIEAPRIYNAGKKKRIIAVDCGMKENIIRHFEQRNVEIKRVPWDYNYLNEEWDGLFVSNGPGDPMLATATIAYMKKAMETKKPIFGICLGSQLMGLAAGASTYKLPHGHRSHNQPCIDTATGRCYLTTQNHGFAVDKTTLPKGWKVSFINANDGTVEGIRHTKLPFFSAQFHPEANPGPEDTNFLFDEFIDML